MLKQNNPNGYHISKGSDDIYWILNEGEDYRGKLSTDLKKAKVKAKEKIGYVPDVVIWYRKNWEKFEKSDAEIYYLSQLPVIVNSDEVTGIVSMAMIISFLATLYPAWKAANLEPVKALRYD